MYVSLLDDNSVGLNDTENADRRQECLSSEENHVHSFCVICIEILSTGRQTAEYYVSGQINCVLLMETLNIKG